METTTFKRLKVYGRNSLKTKEIDKKIEIWEIAFNFIYEIPLKKFGPKKSSPKKIEITSKFKWKILYKLIGPRTKIIGEFPLNFICVYCKGKSLLFFSKKSTFRLIFEKCRRSSVILKIVGATPQLDQNIKPTRYLSGQFFFCI